MTAGEDVLVFYNDRASFQSLVQMMRLERERLDESSALRYGGAFFNVPVSTLIILLNVNTI